MAKKNGLSLGMIISSIAVGAAAGVFYYYRKAELKKLADDIVARVKLADGTDDEPCDWETHPDTDDVNIVDSGISLESVEEAAEAAVEEAAEAVEEAAEAVEEAAEAAEEAVEAAAEAEDDDEDDIEPPKKPWFWSK